MKSRKYLVDENDEDDEEMNATTSSSSPIIAHSRSTPSSLSVADRRWRINVVSDGTQMRVPRTIQQYHLTVEDRVLMNYTSKCLKLYENRFHSGRNVILSETELINQLISLLDASKKIPFLVTESPNSHSLDQNYTVYDEITQQSPIGVYVEPYLESHRQLNALVFFVQNRNSQCQMVQLLKDFVIGFLSQHTRAIARFYSSDDLGLRTLFHSVRERIIALSAVYDVTQVLFDVDTCSYETTDLFLERFLSLILFAELKPSVYQKTIAPLEHALIEILERYFDHIFRTGQLDQTLAKEFIFYSSDGEEALRNQLTRCSFWTRDIRYNVKDGAANAQRLRSGNSDCKALGGFSTFLRRALRPNQQTQFITRRNFILSFEYACEMCSMLIFTGFAVREMAFDLFGATRDVQPCSIAVSFQNSLLLTGFNQDLCDRWTVSCKSGLLSDLIIKPKLSWPMYHVISENLLLTLNQCLCFLLKLHRAQEALSSVRIDLSTRKEVNIGRHRLNHLICVIAQPLTAISEIFFSHLQALLSKKFDLVASSKTLEEAHSALSELNDQLANLIMRSGARGLIHDAISKLCERALEVELRWRNDAISVAEMIAIHKTVRREKDLLMGLGRSMHGTIFTFLQAVLS